MFATIAESIRAAASPSARLADPPKGGIFNVDEIATAIEGQIDGTEDTTNIIVRHIPQNDRRLREVMVSINHVLADVPSPLLFGQPFASG